MLSFLKPIAPLLAELKRHQHNMFPAHTWLYRSDDDRICSVCDREEYFDFGGGAAGSEWTMLLPGHRGAHFIPKQAPANASSTFYSPVVIEEHASAIVE
jgi:hypothetical protein